MVVGIALGFFRKYSVCSAALLEKVLPKKCTSWLEPMMAESWDPLLFIGVDPQRPAGGT